MDDLKEEAVSFFTRNKFTSVFFSDVHLAEEAIDSLIIQPSFNKHPCSSFVDEYSWKKGIAKIDDEDVEII